MSNCCANSCCNQCGNTPCTCGAIAPCPPIEVDLTFENANLAGVGVFGAMDGTTVKFRGVGSGDDIVKVNYNATTKVIEIWLDKSKLLTQQVWNNATVKDNSAPDYQGQLGVLRSDSSVWVAFGVLTGQWQIVKQQATFTNAGTRATTTPLYLGQLGVTLSDGSLYRATGLTPGAWTLII